MERDCNTCDKHIQAEKPNKSCTKCLETRDLSKWIPIQLERLATVANPKNSNLNP